jgi:hypothetical protein
MSVKLAEPEQLLAISWKFLLRYRTVRYNRSSIESIVPKRIQIIGHASNKLKFSLVSSVRCRRYTQHEALKRWPAVSEHLIRWYKLLTIACTTHIVSPDDINTLPLFSTIARTSYYLCSTEITFVTGRQIEILMLIIIRKIANSWLLSSCYPL